MSLEGVNLSLAGALGCSAQPGLLCMVNLVLGFMRSCKQTLRLELHSLSHKWRPEWEESRPPAETLFPPPLTSPGSGLRRPHGIRAQRGPLSWRDLGVEEKATSTCAETLPLDPFL